MEREKKCTEKSFALLDAQSRDLLWLMFNEGADTTSNSASVYLRQIPRAPGNWSHNECPLIRQTEEKPTQRWKRHSSKDQQPIAVVIQYDHAENVDHRRRGARAMTRLLWSRTDVSFWPSWTPPTLIFFILTFSGGLHSSEVSWEAQKNS